MPCGKDLPEPEWWKRARAAVAEGHSISATARNLGKSRTAVRHAINPAARAEQRERARAYYREHGPDSAERNTDNKRLKARALARDQWREAGRTRDLKWYYRDLQCL